MKVSGEEFKASCRSRRSIKRHRALAAGGNCALSDERVTEIRFRRLVPTLCTPHEFGGLDPKLLRGQQSTDNFRDSRFVY
jgi:hypothetical protein